MRYLILSDIHSNLEALEAVLAASARQYDAVLMLGDVVGYGADPNAVVDKVRTLKPVASVRGNHDKVAAGLDSSEEFNSLARAAALWTQRTLTPARRGAARRSAARRAAGRGRVCVDTRRGSRAGPAVRPSEAADLADDLDAALRPWSLGSMPTPPRASTCPTTRCRCSDGRPNDAAPHHPARRGRRDRQEHVRLRVRRGHRRHRLRAHVPRRGDVRHRPCRARRDVPQGAQGPGPRVPHHSRPRGSRRRSAVRPARVPGCPGLRLDPRPGPPREQGQGAQAPQQPALCARAGRRAPDRTVRGRRLPDRTLHPGRDGPRPADAGRRRRPHRRLQVRPHPGRRQAVGLRDPRQARRRGRHPPPVRLHSSREPRLHAVRADGRRGLPRDHGTARRPGHRGDVREQHRPRPAGPRRGRLVRPPGDGHRPLDGAELPDRDGSSATSSSIRRGSSPRTRSTRCPTTSSSSARRAPRASRWPVWRGWPTATTASSRSKAATPSS